MFNQTIEDEEDICIKCTDISKSCIIPSIEINWNSPEITKETFREIRDSISDHLVTIFSVYKKYFNIFTSPSTKYTEEFRQNFIRIICQQTSSYQNDIFNMLPENSEKFIKEIINKDFESYFFNDSKLISIILSKYENEIISRKKYNSKEEVTFNGVMIYEFLRFCELYFNSKSSRTQSYDINTGRCKFILAIGTNLVENYDPQIKLLGLNYYNIILTKFDEKIIKEMNIHEVIFSTALPNIEKVKEEDVNLILWECLYSSLALLNTLSISKWNKIDDLYLSLTKKCLFESNHGLSLRLHFFLNKISAMSIKDNEIVNRFTDFDYMKSLIDNANDMDYILYDEITELRSVCQKYKSFQSYRWVKRFLSLYLAEQQKLIGDENFITLYIFALHVSYLLVVYSVPPEILHNQLIEFTNRFIKTLMLILSQNKHNIKVKKAAFLFIETFFIHIDMIKNCSVEVNMMKISLKTLMYNEFFLKCIKLKSS